MQNVLRHQIVAAGEALWTRVATRRDYEFYRGHIVRGRVSGALPPAFAAREEQLAVDCWRLSRHYDGRD